MKNRYNPYGHLLGSSGSLAGVNTLRFSSKLWFQSEGLYYYGYRFYEPNLQRWITRDPVAERGGFNLYSFVRNAPSGLIDPFGLEDKDLPPGFLCYPPGAKDRGTGDGERRTHLTDCILGALQRYGRQAIHQVIHMALPACISGRRAAIAAAHIAEALTYRNQAVESALVRQLDIWA